LKELNKENYFLKSAGHPVDFFVEIFMKKIILF